MGKVRVGDSLAPPLRPRPFGDGGPLIPRRPRVDRDLNPTCGHFWLDHCDGCGTCTSCRQCRCGAAEVE